MGAQREILIANNKLRPIALKRVKRQLITCATRGSANARVARKEILLAGNKKRQIAQLLAHRRRFMNAATNYCIRTNARLANREVRAANNKSLQTVMQHATKRRFSSSFE